MKRLDAKTIVLYCAGNVGANMAYAFANTALPLYLAAYHLPNLLIGFLAQERSLVAAVSQPLIGALSDRLPPGRFGRRRPFLLIGAPLTAATLVLLAFHPALWAVLVLITCFAVFLSVAYNPYLALMPDITPSEQRGRVGGVMALFTVLGMTFALGIAYLFWESGQHLAFVLIGVGIVGGFAITFFSIAEPASPRFQERPLALSLYVRDLLGRRELLKYLAATFWFWFGNGGVTPFVTRYAVEVLGIPERLSFLLLMPLIFGAVLFAIPAGMLTERVGKKPVLAFGMALFGACLLIGGPLVSNMPQAILLMLFAGIANAITTALIFPLLTDLIPAHRAGEFTGIGSLIWSVAQPLGALAAGGIGDLTGSLRGSFAAGGAAMLIACAILIRVHPERPLAQQHSPVDVGPFDRWGPPA